MGREKDIQHPPDTAKTHAASLPPLESLIAGASSALLAASDDQVDATIERTLAGVRARLLADRCALLQVWPEKHVFQITHLSQAENIPPVPLHLDLSQELFPWCYQQLVNLQETVSIQSIEDLPAEAAIDARSLQAWGIQSFLDIPIIPDRTVLYVVAVHAVKDERLWPREAGQHLKHLGEVLVNALERKRKSLEL